MKTLKRHELNFDKTLKYVKYNLSGGNTLSLVLLNSIDFSDGTFFTMLPRDANTERIYEFENGLILKQYPEREVFISGKRSSFSEIPTIHDEISSFILKKSNEDKRLSCVFEEILDSPKSQRLIFFREHNLLYYYNDEIYYIANKNNINEEIILKCIEKSNAIWHFLCILSNVSFDDLSNTDLSNKKITEICINANLIMIGAYDGENFIFWERNK